MDRRLDELRRQYPQHGVDDEILSGKLARTRQLHLRGPSDHDRPHRAYMMDTLFPQVLTGYTDTAGIDEGSADFLYGIVRGLQPTIVLETGTHRGRSTRAIVGALKANAEIVVVEHSYTAYLPLRGHCYTIDAEDHQIVARGAIPADAVEYVTPIIGWTPDVYDQAPLKDLTGIEFAFLDGDHSDEGLLQDLAYVENHRAPECWVAIDNSRDIGWSNLQALLSTYTKHPRISLGTCTGLDLIWMR